MNLQERFTSLAASMIETRRDFHAHPEIAFEETRTAGIVADRLEKAGYAPRRGIGGTGVVAVLEGGRPGPTVLARADMDALPVPDEKDVAYRSTVAGKNHACGHDGHTTILLTIAEVLASEASSLPGRIVFVFQPAEEITEGAKAMLADGALEGIEVDEVVGLHLSSDQPAGVVAVRSGPAMAAPDAFDLVIRGSGGHAAMPQRVVDPVVIAAQVITALQSIVARNVDPVDQAVISITRIEGGTAYNIIPEEVRIAGTIRSFDPATRSALASRLEAVASGLAASLGGSAELTVHEGPPAVVNDAWTTERVREVARRVVGDEAVDEAPMIMGGDDMALWMNQAQGCYFFFGTRSNDATGFPHHHPRFDVDDAVLPKAADVLANVIVDLLERPLERA